MCRDILIAIVKMKVGNKMKKKIVVIGLCVTMAFAVVGCGKKDKANTTTSSQIEKNEDGEFMASKTASKVKKCDYKGVDVGESTTDIAQTDIDSAIDGILSSHATDSQKTEGTVADGDKVNIDYVGTIDGAEFDGGSAQGYDLTIGSNSFIDGFESGLIGANIGDTVTLDLTFPADYTNTTTVNGEERSLAGQAVQFKVTVNYVTETNTPALTDEFVAENSKEYGDTDNVDDFNKYVKDQLVLSNKLQAMWPGVIYNSEVDLDSAEVQEKYADLYKYYEDIVKNNYGTDLETYVEQYGQTMEEFEKTLNDEAEYQIKCKAISNMIARKEGITVPKDEYDYEVQKAMEAYGYSDVASYEKDYPKQETIDSLIYYKVLKFVGDKAKVVKDSETTTIASDSTDTSTESETTTAVE